MCLNVFSEQNGQFLWLTLIWLSCFIHWVYAASNVSDHCNCKPIRTNSKTQTTCAYKIQIAQYDILMNDGNQVADWIVCIEGKPFLGTNVRTNRYTITELATGTNPFPNQWWNKWHSCQYILAALQIAVLFSLPQWKRIHTIAPLVDWFLWKIFLISDTCILKCDSFEFY